jgi:hypothetical protein
MIAIFFSMDETNPDHLLEIRCPGCRSFLVVHLPDPLQPERLLATCPECKSWYLLDRQTSAMHLLPTGDGAP